jgi:hypothetical protein
MPQDDAQAAIWYRKAAEQGNADAEFALATFYGAGRGVRQDFAEAYFWVDLATSGNLAASDMERAVKLRDDDASMLTPGELYGERERVRKWLEVHQAKPQ